VKSERAYLDHIDHCIRRIEEDSAGGREAVFASPTLQDAIVRNLQVLCESTQHMTDASKKAHPEVDWRGIAGMRNVLVHGYFDIDMDSVWDIIQRDLPVLKKAIRQLLAK
jgi:uncharacterized protein with HEPN domain